MTLKIKRPLLRYHGGKFLLAPWIISHFPKHKIYVEPFGGAGSVLIQKRRSYAEVYNDLDGEIVNLFEVVREHGDELIRLIELTPFSRDEFVKSYHPSDNPIELARRTLVRSYMGFGSVAATDKKFGPSSKGFLGKGTVPSTGFRSNSNRIGTTPAHDWRNYPSALPAIIERLRGVVIENRNAIEVIRQHDSADTLHYLDPPYVLSTRYLKEKTSCYSFEMNDEQHVELLELCKTLDGDVILSGYDNEMYNDILKDWDKSIKQTYADGGKDRIEVLWMKVKNQNNQTALDI